MIERDLSRLCDRLSTGRSSMQGIHQRLFFVRCSDSFVLLICYQPYNTVRNDLDLLLCCSPLFFRQFIRPNVLDPNGAYCCTGDGLLHQCILPRWQFQQQLLHSQLATKGIETVEDLAEFSKDDIDQIAKNLQATVDGNGFSFVFGAKSHKQLIVAADLVHFYETVGLPHSTTAGSVEQELIDHSFTSHPPTVS